MKPSRYILNSDYATLKNDEEVTLSIDIPNSFTITPGRAVTFSATATGGQKSAGMRWSISSSKYPNVNLVSPTFTIPCKCSVNFQGEHMEWTDTMTGFLYRSGPRTIKMDIIPNYSYVVQVAGATISECGQRITAKVQTFLSPFEA